MTPRLLLLGLMTSLAIMAPGSALATQIFSSGDAALTGALIQNFDGEAADTYFTSQTFLIGADGFTVTPLAQEMHIDVTYCASFGTTGNCLDTMNNAGQANDDFDVVFTDKGVSAFGFALNALDTAWTVRTYDVFDNLLGTYTIPSQSPGLTGFNRRGYFGAAESVAIQYFTVRSAGNDRALIDDFAYVVPEPNVSMLISLGLLVLAGNRAGTQNKQPKVDSAA
jgi:hypothetical protein